VTGVALSETGDWFRRVASFFDGVVPRYVDIAVPISRDTVVALWCESDRSPYVVRNPAYGSIGAGPIQLEVPWREGTEIRTARREDLMRLLIPASREPVIEPIWAELTKAPSAQPGANNLFLRSNLYLVPQTEGRIVFPLHRCHGSFTLLPSGNSAVFGPIALREVRPSVIDSGDHRMIVATTSELIVNGPGRFQFEASAEIVFPQSACSSIDVDATLEMVPGGQAVRVAFRVDAADSAVSGTRWQLRTRASELL
jgi:hypothetical protein